MLNIHQKFVNDGVAFPVVDADDTGTAAFFFYGSLKLLPASFS